MQQIEARASTLKKKNKTVILCCKSGGRAGRAKAILQKNGIKELIVYGIATDYCVKATAIDAVAAGYKVTVIEGLSRGVAPDTTAKALEEMKAKGIIIKTDVDI